MRNPFFFLLLDSFLESSLFVESPVFAASVAGAELASVASLFAGVSAAPAAAGGFFAASSLAAAGVAVVGAVQQSGAAGVDSVPASFGGSLVAGALAVPSLVAGAAFSDPTVSAVPVDPACPRDNRLLRVQFQIPRPPIFLRASTNPLRTIRLRLHVRGSGSRGSQKLPIWTALIKSSGLLYIGVCGLGVFCSAVIHASALGSACGIGTPDALSLSLAPGARLDNG